MPTPDLMRQIAREREYFARLRATVYAHALPTLIIHDGSTEIERIYPDYVNDAIATINSMETACMSKYDNAPQMLKVLMCLEYYK